MSTPIGGNAGPGMASPSGSRCPVGETPHNLDVRSLRKLSALQPFLEEGGLHAVALGGTAPGWFAADYNTAARVLTEPRLRGEYPGSPGLSLRSFDALSDDEIMEEQQLFFLGASEHAQLRRTIANALSQRRVAELTERIRKTAETLLDAITPGVPVDLGEAFAWPFPVAALCDLLGIPPADHGLIYDYIFQATHPGTADAPETSVADYLADLIERRRAAPGDDLLSDMCRDEGTDAAHSAVLAAARLLIVVGPRPVAHLLTDGLALLLHERDRWETLLAKPHLLNGAVEELLRFVAPASLAFRYGREEVQIAGRSLPQGSRVYCSLLAANRDPARFADPDRFDLERPAGQHLAFGLGYRHCLGAALVRAEIRVALAVLLERFPQIRLATPDERFQVGAGGGTRGGNMVVILDPSR